MRWSAHPTAPPRWAPSTFPRPTAHFRCRERDRGRWLPTDVDKAHVRSLMRPVHERGKIAAWIAPPRNGINGKPFDYDYVHLA